MPYTVSPSPWTVRETDFPVNAPPTEVARHLLRYAILAPSTKNTQPWSFRIDGSTVHVRPDLARWQRVADPDQRELHLSLGCALENLIVAADHFGYGCAVTYGPPESGPADAVASVTITPARAGTPHMRPAGLFTGLKAGQVFERVFLTATLLGLSVQPMSQALEIPTLRSLVAKLFPGASPFAQQPFLIGYADRRRRRHTPRRRVEDVVASS